MEVDDKIEVVKDENVVDKYDKAQDDKNCFPPMYKCKVYNCDGAWGTSNEFSNHIVSLKHKRAYFQSLMVRTVANI